MATVGYGDLTAAADLGRMLAICAALIGQLYLVTVVALVIGRSAKGAAEAQMPNRNPRKRSIGSGGGLRGREVGQDAPQERRELEPVAAARRGRARPRSSRRAVRPRSR